MDKPQTTRERNKAAREAARAEREAQERADKALVLEAVRDALKDKEATTGSCSIIMLSPSDRTAPNACIAPDKPPS